MVYNTNDRLVYYGSTALPDQTSPTCPTCKQKTFKSPWTNEQQPRQMALKGLFETCFVFWPEVVFFVSAFFFEETTFKMLKARDMKLVMLHTESPYQDREQVGRGQYADLNLLNDPTNLQAFKDLGPAAAYMPHAYDSDIHFPPLMREYYTQPGVKDGLIRYERVEPYECDLSFIGTGFKSRRDFFGKMDFSGLTVALGGGGWGDAAEEPENVHILDWLGHDPQHCVDNEEGARIYRLSKVGINKYREESEEAHKGEGWAMGPREVEMAACELFFLRDPRPEGDEIFEGILPTFSGPDEASDLARYWAAHDSLREDRARRARAAIQDRTFDNHAARAMQLMEDAGIC
jgi:spore maturation protein CgeB